MSEVPAPTTTERAPTIGGVVAVVGSRTIPAKHFDTLCAILDPLTPSKIVSGGARGADYLGEKYANAREIPLVKYMPDWGKWGKSAGPRRNKLIVEDADEVVALWDGESPGTKNSIDLALKAGKLFAVIRVERDGHVWRSY